MFVPVQSVRESLDKVGVIVKAFSFNYEVAFDDFVGHPGSGYGTVDGKDNRWYVDPENLELLEEAPKFKVGDKVRFTNKCRPLWFFGPHTPYLTGTIKGASTDKNYDYRVQVDGCSSLGYVSDEHVELITPVIAAAPVAPPTPVATDEKGTFILILQEGSKLMPSTNPKVYTTAAQARRVARKMTEEHAKEGQRFVVFKAVGYAEPVITKKVESTFSDC
jgi:hypothetical protein